MPAPNASSDEWRLLVLAVDLRTTGIKANAANELSLNEGPHTASERRKADGPPPTMFVREKSKRHAYKRGTLVYELCTSSHIDHQFLMVLSYDYPQIAAGIGVKSDYVGKPEIEFCKLDVAGSIPAAGTTPIPLELASSFYVFYTPPLINADG